MITFNKTFGCEAEMKMRWRRERPNCAEYLRVEQTSVSEEVYHIVKLKMKVHREIPLEIQIV